MRRAVCLLCVSLMCLPSALSQKQGPDFTGSYVLKSFTRSDSSIGYTDKISAGKGALSVVQTANSIEFSYTLPSGKTAVRRYNLDGSDSSNVDFDGTPRTERAILKGKTLIVKSTMNVPTGPLKGTPIDGTETWELSRDLKTLTSRAQLKSRGTHLLGDTFTAIYFRQ
jgi:hypothetical protein